MSNLNHDELIEVQKDVSEEQISTQSQSTATFDFQINDALLKFVELSNLEKNVSLTGKPRKMWLDILKRFLKNYIAVFSLIVILAIFTISVIVPAISPYSATKPVSEISLDWITNLPPSYAPVVTEILDNSRFQRIQEIQASNPDLKILIDYKNLGSEYMVTYNKYLLVNTLMGEGHSINLLLGSNNLGIDIWTRTWFATRDSITLAFLVATTDAIIGITIGSILGFYAGTWIDAIFTRVIDVIINIPTLIWFLMLITIVPAINQFTLYLILISIGWVYMVNNSRLWMITVKDQEFILAAKSIGVSTPRQIFIHGLPMIIGKLATNYVRRIVIVILSLSSLTFLGFLSTTGNPNLGTLLQEARTQIDINIWVLLLPSLILLFFSLASQFVANGLHDALDPKVGRGK